MPFAVKVILYAMMYKDNDYYYMLYCSYNSSFSQIFVWNFKRFYYYNNLSLTSVETHKKDFLNNHEGFYHPKIG